MFGRNLNLKTITANVKKWKELGTVQDCHKGTQVDQNQDAVQKIEIKSFRSLTRSVKCPFGESHLLLL